MGSFLWTAAALLSAIFLLPGDPVYAAGCSIEQRIELAKAGYKKAEVDELCAQSSQASPQTTNPSVAPASTPIRVLQAASYNAVDTPDISTFHTRWKCEFLSDSVKMNNIKRTFGGYDSRVYPYNIMYIESTRPFAPQFEADKSAGTIMAHVTITASGIRGANNRCRAVVVWQEGIGAEQFDALVAEKRREQESVIRALAALGIKQNRTE
jgi:hypothetical protein